jgi:hypothetical protein
MVKEIGNCNFITMNFMETPSVFFLILSAWFRIAVFIYSQ